MWVSAGILGGVIALLLAAETYARVGLGLGNPPLWRSDPEIEYLPLPGRSYRRFGNQVSYNAHSMRSDEFPLRKTDPREFRVLVAGDSIVNGGSLTDQRALATSILQRELSDAMRVPVVVANVSAGSWGPPNYLAYVRRYGLFDADVVVIVVNSEDYLDAPTFEPLDDRRPQRKPTLALLELVTKHAGRRRRRRAKRGSSGPAPGAVDACLGALRELVRMARESGAAVHLVQYLSHSEVDHEPEVGYHEIGRVAREMGIAPLQLGPVFSRSLRRGVDPYRDGFHPNDVGQRLLADVLRQALLEDGASGTTDRGRRRGDDASAAPGSPRAWQAE